jgi:hypothetical protein
MVSVKKIEIPIENSLINYFLFKQVIQSILAFLRVNYLFYVFIYELICG